MIKGTVFTVSNARAKMFEVPELIKVKVKVYFIVPIVYTRSLEGAVTKIISVR